MKTITIPSNYDPFRVTVNGKEYVYQGGSTVSVPDDVADVIENMIQPEYAEHSDFATEEYVKEKLAEAESVAIEGAKVYTDSVARKKIYLPDTLTKGGELVASVSCASNGSKVLVGFGYDKRYVNFSINESDKVSFVDFGELLSADALAEGIATLDGYSSDGGQKFSISGNDASLVWTFVFDTATDATNAVATMTESLPTECTILVEPSEVITAEVV